MTSVILNSFQDLYGKNETNIFWFFSKRVEKYTYKGCIEGIISIQPCIEICVLLLSSPSKSAFG
jgi:hypothetical protein